MSHLRAESKPSRGLESLNSQLMTHGWTKKPMRLDALSSKDLAHVVGIMFELLGSSVVRDLRAGQPMLITTACRPTYLP